jgi:hypothetical protein
MLTLALSVLAAATVPNGFVTGSPTISTVVDCATAFPPFSFALKKMNGSVITDAVAVVNIGLWLAAPLLWGAVIQRARRIGRTALFPRGEDSFIKVGGWPWIAFVVLAIAGNTYMLTLSDGDLRGCSGCLSDSRLTVGALTWLFFWTQGFLLAILIARPERSEREDNSRSK